MEEKQDNIKGYIENAVGKVKCRKKEKRMNGLEKTVGK